MKNVILTLSITLACALANAYELAPVGYREFTLATAHMSAIHQTGHVEVVGGSLKIGKKTVELVLQRHQNCPANMVCIAAMPAPIIQKLPIVEVRKSACGDIIVARQDMRPVDGTLEQIEIKDFSHALCDIMIPHVIQAKYTTAFFDRNNGQEITGTSLLQFDPKMYLMQESH